jgi:hypothetical protein
MTVPGNLTLADYRPVPPHIARAHPAYRVGLAFGQRESLFTSANGVTWLTLTFYVPML